MAKVSYKGVVIETELAPEFPEYAEKVLKIVPVAHRNSPQMDKHGYGTRWEHIMPWFDKDAINNVNVVSSYDKLMNQLDNRKHNAKFIEEIAEIKNARLREKMQLGLIRYGEH
ncbi:hypothetical protein J7E81_15260 [Bacillus sp. ISL-18]|uniref:hypothetical protein n=1 Tax=Bacillus sp. ISL-18 TaxID=2819118 RepID=UPI001BE8DF70|nr:hypothetical protein [Bacillus sp. ISL-18]MBT2656576.1 hypothetical protein [Bacillus sp. ISL-18]